VRSVLTQVGLVVAVLGVPVLGVAASGLSGTMHQWREDARAMNKALSTTAPDTGAIRQALQGYAADGKRISVQFTGQSRSARDLRQRFAAFSADAQKALADLGRPPALKADFSKISSDCQSCHDIYN